MMGTDPKHIVAVSGLYYDTLGRVLLVETPRRGWECPGGQVEPGEDLIAAAVRETREETGCLVTVERLVAVYTNPAPPEKVMFQFVGRHVGGEVGGGDEKDAGWFTVEEARAMVTFPANRLKLEDALRGGERPVYRVYTTRPWNLVAERVL